MAGHTLRRRRRHRRRSAGAAPGQRRRSAGAAPGRGRGSARVRPRTDVLAMAAELWADEREVVASAYESELQPEESERGDLALTLRGLGPHTAGGAEDVWVRLDVRFALSGVPAASGLPDFAAEDVEAEVLNARGMDEDTAVEMLAAARAEALDEGCAEPPGVCLAWASALVEALTAANEAAPAEGDCSVCLCPLRDEDDDEPEAVVRVSSCMHRFHRACIVRWWTTAADAALAEDISRRNPTHTPAAPRCEARRRWCALGGRALGHGTQ